jgi:hypothetical protein
MARHSNTIMGKTAYASYSHTPAVDLQQGGQQGHFNDFRFYVNNSAYVTRNTVAILVEAPRGFRYLDNPNEWVGALKAIIEKHSQRIEGLRSTITVENVENAVGGDGNMQEDVSNVTRERSVPVHVIIEKYGMPVNKFLEGWITGLLMDPVTKIPNVSTLGRANGPTDLLPDFTSATVLYFEPDPTFRTVQKAWLCTNMRPKTGGIVEGTRDLTQGGESLTYNIEFTALTQVGVGVNNFAQRVLDSMNLTGTNPNLREAFQPNLDADVAASNVGYKEQVNEASREFVRPNR